MLHKLASGSGDAPAASSLTLQQTGQAALATLLHSSCNLEPLLTAICSNHYHLHSYVSCCSTYACHIPGIFLLHVLNHAMLRAGKSPRALGMPWLKGPCISLPCRGSCCTWQASSDAAMLFCVPPALLQMSQQVLLFFRDSPLFLDYSCGLDSSTDPAEGRGSSDHIRYSAMRPDSSSTCPDSMLDASGTSACTMVSVVVQGKTAAATAGDAAAQKFLQHFGCHGLTLLADEESQLQQQQQQQGSTGGDGRGDPSEQDSLVQQLQAELEALPDYTGLPLALSVHIFQRHPHHVQHRQHHHQQRHQSRQHRHQQQSHGHSEKLLSK